MTRALRHPSCVSVLVLSLLLLPTIATGQVESGPYEVQSVTVEDIPLSADILFEGDTITGIPGPDETYLRPAFNTALVYHPALSGVPAEGPFPLIVFGHGQRAKWTACSGSPVDNEQDYRRFSGILGHLTSWGFIVMSVDLSWLTPAEYPVGIDDRMYALRDAADYMFAENSREGSLFRNRIRTLRIGVLGHSMGADTAVSLGASGLLEGGIGAIAALSPPNHAHGGGGNYDIENSAPRPVLLFQATRDWWYDRATPRRAESLYDAYDAADANKYLLTITDAYHFGYSDGICVTGDPLPDLPGTPLAAASQQQITQAYLAAFFRRYLRSECVPALLGHLTGASSFPELSGFSIAIEADSGAALACNQVPICDANGPYVAECAGASTPVTLDGSGSSDPDLEALFSRWTGPFTEGDVTGTAPTVSFSGPGTFYVHHDASDGLESVSCSAEVVIQDTSPPTITAPPDMTVECTSPAGASPGDLGTPVAADVCDPSLTITSDAPATLPFGDSVVTWRATDDSGRSAADTQVVTVVDTTPPVVSLSVTPAELWPPNHQMVEIAVDVLATDVCDAAPSITLTSITMNEGDETATFDPAFDVTLGDGHTTNDIQVDEDGTIHLRAERSGRGTGRVYTITYTATDASGRHASATATVTVPHSR